MKLSTLERAKNQLKTTVFKDYADQVDVTIGLKCLVVLIGNTSWSGPTPTFFENRIPITYLFGARNPKF
jgi:hypothetical protein